MCESGVAEAFDIFQALEGSVTAVSPISYEIINSKPYMYESHLPNLRKIGLKSY